MATAAKHKPTKKPVAKIAAKTVPKSKPREERSTTMAENKPDPFMLTHPVAPAPAAAPASTSVVADDMLTEQEKDTSGETPGVGPVGASEISPGPAETIEDLGIGPREPYPSGNPPASEPPPVEPLAKKK